MKLWKYPIAETRYKWCALALLWVTYFLLQGTRQIYGATLPQIRLDFGVTDVQMGVVASVFFLAYAIAVPFGGFAADFFRRKWVIVIGSALFFSGVFAASFVSTIGLMVLTYGILNGVGQSLVPTPSTSILQQLHKDSRAMALSIYQLAAYVGIILCSVMAGWLGSLGPGGWRRAFLIFGAFGILWIAALVFCLRDTPPEQTSSAVAQRASFKEAWLAMFSKPSAILMTLVFGLGNFGDIGFRTWMPTYLQRMFADMTPASAAFHAVFWFYLGGFFGILVASRISDGWRRRGNVGSRLDCNLIGHVLCAFFIVAVAQASGSLPVLAATLAGYGFVHGFYDANFIASFYEVITPRYRTSAYGLYAAGAFLIGSFAPAVLGWLGGTFSMKTAFAILGIFYILAATLTATARIFFFKNDYVKED